MALVVLDRKSMDNGTVQVTLSDGRHRVTVTSTPETERMPERDALYEVMFNKEQERLAKARRIMAPGQPT